MLAAMKDLAIGCNKLYRPKCIQHSSEKLYYPWNLWEVDGETELRIINIIWFKKISINQKYKIHFGVFFRWALLDSCLIPTDVDTYNVTDFGWEGEAEMDQHLEILQIIWTPDWLLNKPRDTQGNQSKHKGDKKYCIKLSANHCKKISKNFA